MALYQVGEEGKGESVTTFQPIMTFSAFFLSLHDLCAEVCLPLTVYYRTGRPAGL